ncbi:MAG: hypothetical protein HOW73_42555 [Polyangiaceae bacterium]|nr:hypothetical protein [Polyangiaceae bacterium]
MRQFALLALAVGVFGVGCANGGGDAFGGGSAGQEPEGGSGGSGNGGAPSNNDGGGGTDNVTTNTSTTNMMNTSTSTTAPTSTGTSMECTGFLCANGTQCIPAAQECDSTQHCSDGSDEAPFNATCPSNTTSTGPGGGGCTGTDLPCLFAGGCYTEAQACDGIPDCGDATDELFCGGGGGPGANWVCDSTYYGDGYCDCGCGEVDSDCLDATSASCEYCESAAGSCSTDDCALIDPNDNSTCI